MKTIWTSVKVLVFFTILTGAIYPLTITGITQLLFPNQANGSIVFRNKKAIGSELIGQTFDSVVYFSSRPSAIGYNPLPSGGSNLGLTQTKLLYEVMKRKKHFIAFNQLTTQTPIPSEMLFASGSGLDPHITPQAALLQVNRIAKARRFDTACKQKLIQLIHQLTEPPQFFCFGEQRINVLLLNVKADSIR